MQIAFISYYENIRIDFPKSNPLELDYDGYTIFLSNLDDEPITELRIPIISPKKSNTDIPDYGIKVEIRRYINNIELNILWKQSGSTSVSLIEEQDELQRDIIPIIESIFAIIGPHSKIPIFQSNFFHVELIAENEEDVLFLENKQNLKFTHNISYHNPKLNTLLPHSFTTITENLAIFHPYSLAIKLLNRNEQQMPFMLFYRILEGFSEKGGFSSISNQKQFKKYLRLTYDFIKQNKLRTVKLKVLKNSLQNIFDGLRLDDENTKTKIGKIDNGEKFLKALKQVRHTITHFDYDKSDKHYYPHLHQDLEQINYMLSIFCNVMIKDKLNIEINNNNPI